MNYTEKHRLPQWVKTDRIMMEDFNAAMANIEKGLNKTAQDAASATAAAKQEAASATAAAQATANTAVSKANAAQTAADAAQSTADAAYSPGQPPYVVGTYTGTGADQAITLGFRPKFIIITCADSHEAPTYSLATGADTVRLEFTSTGFLLKPLYVANHAIQFPHVNYHNKAYVYIAFR